MTALLAIVVVGILGVAAVVGSKAWRRTPPQPAADDSAVGMRVGDFELVPESASQARASAVLPTKGSEDARAILSRPALTKPRVEPDERDYGPDAQTEFTVELRFPDNRIVTTTEVDAAFGPEWRRSVGGATFYGLSPDSGRWTYVHAADAPTRWKTLAVSKDLLRTFSKNPTVESALSLDQFVRSVRECSAKLAGSKHVPRESTADAAARAARYVAAWRDCDKSVFVVLSAKEIAPFDGRKVWDVMLSLGLEWGDMDLFHWKNQGEFGDDMLFSVSTSSEPGYFLPEVIADGTTFEDLVFEFSVPRSPAPREILAQMLEAASYSHRRLGGLLLDENGTQFDERRAFADLDRTVSRLAEAGLLPGESATLRIF